MLDKFEQMNSGINSTNIMSGRKRENIAESKKRQEAVERHDHLYPEGS